MSILPLVLFLLALALSLVIIQVGTMALMLTGLSREIARFQSHSAFTGVGFTTEEAEAVVNHPVRRHICMALMILGKLGVASLMATLLVTVMQTEASSGDRWILPFVLLIGGVGTLWLLAVSPWVERQLNKPIAFALKRFSSLNVTDYVALLQLEGDFTVSELSVHGTDWLSGKTLVELALAREGLLVLGIRRKSGDYVGAPSGETRIEAGDIVVLYGPAGRIEELDNRRTGHEGDIAHDEAKKAYDSYLVEVVPPSEQPEQQTADADHT